jgi:hypothetical protein
MILVFARPCLGPKQSRSQVRQQLGVCTTAAKPGLLLNLRKDQAGEFSKYWIASSQALLAKTRMIDVYTTFFIWLNSYVETYLQSSLLMVKITINLNYL